MPKMTDRETAEFLDEREHLLRLATIDDDGMPRLTPVWFTHRDGTLLFTPRQASVFLANVRRDPRVAISVDETALPYRKISVQGRVRIAHPVGEDDAWRDVYREIACRYIDEAGADRYLEATRDQARALLAVDLEQAKVTTWRMPVDGEAGSGIWARRFYAEGTRMAAAADGARSSTG